MSISLNPFDAARLIKRRLKSFIFYDVVHGRAQVNPHAVFLLGSPKSGTTAIARLLANATQQSLTPDFLRAIPRADLQQRLVSGDLPFETFIEQYKYEFSNDIIKEPFLSFFTPPLMQHFPEAQYVFIVRDPHQNIRSILNRLGIPGNLDALNYKDFPALDKTPVWKLAFNSEIFGYTSRNYIEAMAQRWDYAADLYRQYEDRITLIRYEDFIQDKAAVIRRLSEMLGLPYHNDISDQVDKQYQPKGNRSIDPKDFFGAENYKLIAESTAENSKYFGYI